MRPRQAVLLALLVVLAGCSAGFTGTPTATETATPSATPTDTDTATPTATEAAAAPPDPETDVLGWENGRWANESLTLDRSDGLNETEIEAVVARAMARVETVRELEFEEDVPVNLVSREEFRNSSAAGGSADYSDAFRAFDNAKFEALFLVGEDRDSLAVQSSNRGSSVAGYFSPSRDEIVVIYPGDTPDLPGEGTLSHELTHAIQDQYFDLTSIRASTREESNAQNGLIEGEANLVQDRYMANCGEGWECLAPPQSGGGGGGGDLHLGIYIMNFFPYAAGPGFVAYYQERGGWDRIDEMYDRLPESTEQVMEPPLYAVNRDSPTEVQLTDTQTNGWERVRPPSVTTTPSSASPR
ncbi:Hvo_1808 family surface protein [Halosegnis marinus]|uniref:Hvo_1808 family surface protein n=1 Tax=Halosegnis marinus TaxID=3034023 RepID=UPI00360AB1C8